MGFSCSSVGIESTCNAGDPSLSPWLGRSAGEGIGYPLQYSWAYPVAHLVNNPPAMWETWRYIYICVCVCVCVCVYSHYTARPKIIKHSMSVISQLETKKIILIMHKCRGATIIFK